MSLALLSFPLCAAQSLFECNDVVELKEAEHKAKGITHLRKKHEILLLVAVHLQVGTVISHHLIPTAL